MKIKAINFDSYAMVNTITAGKEIKACFYKKKNKEEASFDMEIRNNKWR